MLAKDSGISLSAGANGMHLSYLMASLASFKVSLNHERSVLY